MVHRARGIIKDMEFVQFHPTALFHSGETHPAYLITEAMRGYGGILRLPSGEEFMQILREDQPAQTPSSAEEDEPDAPANAAEKQEA